MSDQPIDQPDNPNATEAHPEPTQHIAGTHDTTEDSFTPPLSEIPLMSDYISTTDDALMQVTTLSEYLERRWPDEIALSNRQAPERPVETAIRLLDALSATAPASRVTRCGETYCNKPEGHLDEHGWIHNG